MKNETWKILQGFGAHGSALLITHEFVMRSWLKMFAAWLTCFSHAVAVVRLSHIPTKFKIFKNPRQWNMDSDDAAFDV